MKYHPFIRTQFLALLLVLPLPACIHAETEIRDDFGLKNRVAGLPLNGTATEVGNGVWQASKNLIVNGVQDFGYLSLTDDGPLVARVPLPRTAEVITVEAALHVAKASEDIDNWLAIGIGNPKMGNPAWGPGIYLLVSSSGLYTCAYNPNPEDWQSRETVGISRGRVFDYDPEGLTRTKLEYRVDDQTLSAWINDEQVADNLKVPEGAPSVDPAYAGISGFSQKPNIKAVGGFVVNILP